MRKWVNKEFCLGLGLFSVKYCMIDRESIGKSKWSHYREPSMKSKNYRLPLLAVLPDENHIVWQFTLCSSNIRRFKTAWLLPSHEQLCLNTLATVLSIELQLFFFSLGIDKQLQSQISTVYCQIKTETDPFCSLFTAPVLLVPNPRITKCERTASEGGCCPRSNRRQILFVF